ncbi:MAG TPA: DUF455 family protein [Candidatus Acidoferrum sp.]|nr:DUF455 family protein [Candidatus Acidoferrum sp.]
MGAGTQYPTKVVRGVTLRADPARESCFTVVHDAADLADFADMSPVARRQRLHKHVHNEMQSLEMAAQSLADFPDAPWDVRMGIARQCWDETRHSRVLYRRLQEVGGYKGEFPVMNYEWSVTCMMDSLSARLAIQNRTFEGGEIDLLRHLVGVWREAGDDATAELLDGILADEIQHVRLANQWFKQMSRQDPTVLLKLASAVSFLKRVTQAFQPAAGEVNAAGVDLTGFEHVEMLSNVEDRLRAGFTEREIEQIQLQESQIRANAAEKTRTA